LLCTTRTLAVRNTTTNKRHTWTSHPSSKYTFFQIQVIGILLQLLKVVKLLCAVCITTVWNPVLTLWLPVLAQYS
jgi:hypothetical protein